MSEVLCVCKVRGQEKWWMILDCSHWIKWTGVRAPRVGDELLCPMCNTPTVTFGTPTDDQVGGGGRGNNRG